jgi:hypothetical protein
LEALGIFHCNESKDTLYKWPAAAATAIILLRDFLYTRGRHSQAIQLNVILWAVRSLLCPLVVFYIIKLWKPPAKQLILTYAIGFAVYTLLFWAISFSMGTLTMGFDGRKLNLFNIIRHESFVLNLLSYIVTVFATYMWVYVQLNSKKISLLESSLKQPKIKEPLTSITSLLFFAPDGHLMKTVLGSRGVKEFFEEGKLAGR